MRLSLFLACQHLNSGTNLRECEDQSWFKVQAAPYDVSSHPRGYAQPSALYHATVVLQSQYTRPEQVGLAAAVWALDFCSRGAGFESLASTPSIVTVASRGFSQSLQDSTSGHGHFYVLSNSPLHYRRAVFSIRRLWPLKKGSAQTSESKLRSGREMNEAGGSRPGSFMIWQFQT
jgi:hypothetical protein